MSSLPLSLRRRLTRIYNREAKAKEAKDKHNEEHPDYRYKPSAKTSQRKPRPRKPAIVSRPVHPGIHLLTKLGKQPDEDLTEEQLRERRRCEVVAKVILEKRASPTPEPSSSQSNTDAAPQSDVKARLAIEMKRAVEEDKARRHHEEEQRRLCLLPPRPTEPVHKARRPRAATVAPVPPRAASPHSEALPSPMRAASMDPACLPQRSFFDQMDGAAIDADGERIYTCEPVEGCEQHQAYSAAEAQWDIRRPSVIYQDP